LRNCTFENVTQGSIWQVPGKPEQELTFEATWSMMVNATSLVWGMASLTGEAPPYTSELRPVNTGSGNLLKIKLVHGAPNELPDVVTGSPHNPPYDARPQHMGACVAPLFPAGSIPDVRYRRRKDKLLMTTTYSCMLTSGDMP
jgi:hypothetical protein